MRVIQAATKRLVEKHGHLNDINVFPVPDGDTGSNMAGTMRNIVTTSTKSIERSIGKMSNVIAESALMSARGNSGVILAQFLCGFSEGVKGLKRITPSDFSNAASTAARRAMESISDPREGTILTVINDWADHLKANCHNYQNFHELLHDSLEQAKLSVRSTTDKLASLKKADVVDAGGLGFVYLLEGIVEFTERGSLRDNAEDYVVVNSYSPVQDRVSVDSLEFLYCTECLVTGQAIDANALRKQLSPLGDSLIVAGTPEKVRVHVHTNEPETAFAIAATFGTVSAQKAENMLEQHRRLLADVQQQTGIITDSTCDLPEQLLNEYGIRVAPLRLFLNDEEFVDKITISTEDFNSRLASSTSARTSQPAPGDFKRLYEEMQDHYQEVAALHVMARYSGTMQSSKAVGSMVWNDNLTMLDTNTLTGGLGLVVLRAAQRAREGMTAADIVRIAEEESQNVRVFVSMDTLDFAVRGGRMTRSQGMLARLLRIKPVLEFNSREQGKVNVVAKALGTQRSEDKLFAMLARDMQAKGDCDLQFAITHVNVPKVAERYAKRMEKELGVAPLYIMQASPVLGCHSGPGACAVSMLMSPKVKEA
ncbi:DegV family EDD domain-containing protein [Desulfovibrio mangrovi]|uniref:DAK2 domain-containing protein n=1 Tax=Desulfovibrio mangrovi TaxID=2976983 RepID=UPI0022453463|nr:DegV family protein [Desulfovibrio mangrovi]UZP68067.1 DegV family EDD domain-containing protein [Desulfovibrio mangrovi]